MDLKNQLMPSFAEEETEAQRREMLTTYTQLFHGLMGPGIQYLTPSSVLSTKELSPSSRFLPFHIFSSLFLKDVLPDVASKFSGCFQGSRLLLKPRAPSCRPFCHVLYNVYCAVTFFEDPFLSSRLKIAPAVGLASETSE